MPIALPKALLALTLLAPLALAMPAAAQETETRFSDWTMVCRDNNQSVRGGCILRQRLTPTGQEQDLLVVAVMLRPGSNAPTMAYRMPAAAIEGEKLTMTVDKGPTLSLPIDRCEGGFCAASAPLDDKVLPMLTNGNTALVTFPMKQEKSGKTQRFGVKMSLLGFTAAVKALKDKAGM